MIEAKEIAMATHLDIEVAFNNASLGLLVEAHSRRGVPPNCWSRSGRRKIKSTLADSSVVVKACELSPQGEYYVTYVLDNPSRQTTYSSLI